MRQVIPWLPNQSGLSSTFSLVAMAMGLVLVAALLLLSLNAFSGGNGTTATTANTSIFSQSSAEQQIKLCAEGRDSSYGDPPSSAQQAKCVRDLLGEVSGVGGSIPSAP